MDTAGIHVDGHGASDETIAAWKAIRNNQETRLDLQMGEKAATMTLDETDTEFLIRENTFLGNEKLGGLLAFLRADVNEQTIPSVGASGTRSLSTQDLPRPSDPRFPDPGSDPGGGSDLVGNGCSLVDQCVDDQGRAYQGLIDIDTEMISGDCHGCSTSGWMRKINEFNFLGDCGLCSADLNLRGENQEHLDACIAGLKKTNSHCQ
jgi:hypothetical protein